MSTAHSSRTRRYAEGTAFAAAWILLGLGLGLGPNAYLLLGVPLTGLFQCLVRREPLRALWVREAPPFRLGAWGLISGAVLAVGPAGTVIQSFSRRSWIELAWTTSALLGAFAAGYALKNADRAAVKSSAFSAAAAGSIGILFMVAAAAAGGARIPSDRALHVGTVSFLAYFPACFMLEEVSFRGALDAHVHHPGDDRPWISALFVSFLWGVWHLPVVPHPRPWLTVLQLSVVHCAIGVPLSLAWRKSGNLAVTSFTHALIDAVRNALLGA